MFLMIENAGVADSRSFYKLGVSTSRGSDSKIGKFGSGAKMGTLLLIRKGMNPYIYCGTERLEFYTQPNIMGDTEYNDVFLKIGNKKTTELSYSLETGVEDWVSVDMALREYVSNAIDNTDSQDDITIKLVEKPRAKQGVTRVFVPVNSDVNKFVNELKQKFLHFGENIDKTLIPKDKDESAKMYRRGVFVRQLPSFYGNSLYDYNINHLIIDECRNANEYSCRTAAANALSNDEAGMTNMFQRFIDGKTNDNTFEDALYEYDIIPKKWWIELWETLSNGAIIVPNETTIIDNLQKKGFTVVVVPDGWYNRMKQIGIPAGIDKLSTVENKGCEILPPTTDLINEVKKVWSWLEDFRLTESKPLPNISMFTKVMDSGTTIMGYYEDGTVFFNVDYSTNAKVIIEELAHYITDANDNSRDFQDYAFAGWVRALEMIYS